MPRRGSVGLRPIGDSIRKIIERIRQEREERRNKNKPIRTQPKLPGMKKGGMKDPSKAIRSVKPTLGRKKTEEFLRKLKGKKKKMGGGMLRYNKGGGADMSKVKQKKQGPAGGLRKIKKRKSTADTMLDQKGFQLKYPNRGSGPNNPVVMYSVKKGGFPDLSGDGKTTMKDILIGRGVIKKKKGGMLDKNVRVIDLQKQGKTSKKGIRVKGKGKSFMDVYKKTVYNRADGGMVPFGGEKRVPGSGAATRGTGFKGIF
jgi:hypothetical protein